MLKLYNGTYVNSLVETDILEYDQETFTFLYILLFVLWENQCENKTPCSQDELSVLQRISTITPPLRRPLACNDFKLHTIRTACARIFWTCCSGLFCFKWEL